jgi:DNA polymerase I-like protein with 3'-5' exonuclease and polymerase domains|tara:strand:+ start:3455 stop:4639 length:1185 start_codon:yes stop_codon:yes gene_type:complete
LYFQALDIKNECVGVYADGQLHYSTLPEDLTDTWGYANFLEGKDINYASLYCHGQSLDDVCPPAIEDEWKICSERLQAFYRALIEAKIDLNQNCFYDLVPENFIRDYCEIKNKITKHVLENYERPENYEFLLSVQKILSEIRVRQLTIDFSSMKNKLHQYKTRNWRDKLSKTQPYINYNLFGTKTGRLTTRKNSFPILTMAKEYRSVVKPTNDWFLELDFNSAEIRTLLALSNKEQPEQDIHEWNIDNVFGGGITREEAKKSIFAWLYNPDSKSAANKYYDRDYVKDKYWDGTKLKTFFGREIESDEHHAVNYIIQSTTSDLFLKRMVEISKILKESKSQIAFCVHDSLVIDLHDEDKHLVPEIKRVFGQTDLGKFKVNLSAGKNYGELKELKI